jgi:hypothetical protein
VGEESLDFGLPHCVGMADAVEANEAFDPGAVGFLSTYGIMTQPALMADLIEELHDCASLAAFARKSGG